MILEELYAALIEAGASEAKARVEVDLTVLKWMAGSLIAITLMTLGSTIGVLFRLSGN